MRSELHIAPAKSLSAAANGDAGDANGMVEDKCTNPSCNTYLKGENGDTMMQLPPSTIHLQGSDKRWSPRLVNFVTALAYHFCLALPAAFVQPVNSRALYHPSIPSLIVHSHSRQSRQFTPSPPFPKEF